MLLRDLSKVYISRAETTNNYGESEIKWSFVDSAYFNMQQDIDELDIKSVGEADFSIYKARTEQEYDIRKGDGISLEDISSKEIFKPEYRVMKRNKIGWHRRVVMFWLRFYWRSIKVLQIIPVRLKFVISLVFWRITEKRWDCLCQR